MTRSKISLALLFYSMTFASVLLLPRSLHVTPINSNFTNSLPPSLLPSLGAPIPPTGFSTRLSFNSSVQLKPVQVYICAIELMSLLANLPWTFTLPGSITMAGEDPSTEVFLDRCPPEGDSRLRIQYAVLGLYEAAVAIALGSRFTMLNALFYVGELKVGWLEFRPELKALHKSSRIDHLPPLRSGYANSTTTMADSGQIFDPEDKKFVITFEWDRMRIKAQDIFTVILDAFAVAAEHDNKHLDAYIPAAHSASGDTILSTWTVGEKENPHMTWRRLKRALILIWDLLIIGSQGRKARFEGFIFGLRYEGKEIGAGRMLRFDTDNEDAGGSAVEK